MTAVDFASPKASSLADRTANVLGEGQRERITVCLLAVVLTAIAVMRTSPVWEGTAQFAQPFDHHKYIFIAQHGPFAFHIAPFCWRFLHPVLAGMLPFPLQTSFLLLTIAEVFVSGVLIFFIAREFFSQSHAVAALIIYFSLSGVKVALSNFWGVDQLSRLFVIAGFLLLIRRKPILASLVLALGVCSKETVVISAALYYGWNARKIIDIPAFRRGVLFALPIIAVFFAIKLAIPAWNSNPGYVASLPFSLSMVYDYKTSFGYGELISAILRHSWEEPHGWVLKEISVNAFGVLAILPFFAVKENLLLALRFSAFLVLAYIAMFFSSDFVRVICIATPCVMILALNGAQRISRITHAPDFLFTVTALLLFLLTYASKSRVEAFFEVQAFIFIAFLAVATQWSRRNGGSFPVPV